MIENRSEPGPLADFAGLLRRFRGHAGLTQEALAERADLSVGAIGLLETGRRRYPRLETIGRLVGALRLTEADAQRLVIAAKRPPSTETGQQGVPRQLPLEVADFTGRGPELDRLIRAIHPRSGAVAVAIAVISGMGGVGKTTLAVQAGHTLSAEFPDGQLAVNLRGSGTEPRSAVDALKLLLQSLGVPPVGTSDVAVLAGRYRTAIAGRRMLVLLDDAAGVDQVLPLIPGTSSAAVVITSRQRLSELPGAQTIDLGVLDQRDAVQLLGEVVGPSVVSEDPESALRVVQRCGLLPLAVRIAGGQASRSAQALRELASRLADDPGRLDALTGPDGVVNSTIGLSVAALSAGNELDVAAAEAFPLVALFDGDWFPLRAAAKVLARSLDDTEELLERLVDLHLVDTPALHRYRLHDLVRDVGRESARRTRADGDLTDAFQRELECYRAMVWRYVELAQGDNLVDLYGAWTGPSWSADADDLSDRQRILEWLEVELPNLVRLVRAASDGDAGDRLTAVQVALGMPHLGRGLMRFAEVHEATSIVVGLQVELDPRLEHGRMAQMAFTCGWLGQHVEAQRWCDIELPLARAIAEPTQLSSSLITRASNLLSLNRPAEGLPDAEEALRIILESGARTYESAANVAIGTLAGQLGDLARQRQTFDRALQVLPNPRPTTAALARTLIGGSLRSSGQCEAALAVLERALEQSRESKAEALEALVLTELGTTWLAMGDHVRACEALTDGLTIAVRYPREHREAELRHQLGHALTGLGMAAEARAEWEEAIVLHDRMADPRADEVRALLAGLAER
ncbi:NB-ARC domain-containing protein [Kribbella sp. NBC_00382]|uniref:NB-ARC domain-containing protein n=1 Tax=Kribbella sp. NBC_00382 TaxID=2975967 RepID=UPI002E1C6171